MKQAQLQFFTASNDVAVRFSYMTFDGEERLGAAGQAMYLGEFKRFCKTALSRHKRESDYAPWEIRAMVVHFNDGRRFIWQAPLFTKFGAWTKTWQQITDAEKWEPMDYGIIPF